MRSRSVDLDPKQEDSTVLRFVQEAVQKGSSGAGLNEATPQMLVKLWVVGTSSLARTGRGLQPCNG
jgi:hypothetical protein